jgi:K+-transporting ATPase ATPase A chain
MTALGWAQIALVLALVFGAAVPLGHYIAAVLQGGRTFLTPILAPVERGFYRLAGVDPAASMGWRSYAAALIVLSAIHFLMLYAILRLQQHLPLNPTGQDAMSPQLAFNTAISFVTNTNWQAYSGETALSYGTQMWGLTVHNFLSAASGIAAAAVVARRCRPSQAAD